MTKTTLISDFHYEIIYFLKMLSNFINGRPLYSNCTVENVQISMWYEIATKNNGIDGFYHRNSILYAFVQKDREMTTSNSLLYLT